MKKLLIVFGVLLSLVLNSCGYEPNTCEYTLTYEQYVPDSLKEKQRIWITETVRAATNRLTTSDYENVEETIEQAEETAESIFSVNVLCLSKITTDSRGVRSFRNIRPEEFTPAEKLIFDNIKKTE